MTGPAGLERGYRRLLGWYPRAYWREHEEEMLAVLLEGARKGQRRPGGAESADLIRGALRMRLHRGGPGEPGWRDALAVFSIAAPLLLVAASAVVVAAHVRYPHLAASQRGLPFSGVMRQRLLAGVVLRQAAVGQVAIAAAVLLRLRVVAVALIAAAVGYWVVGQGGYDVASAWEMFYMSFYVLEAAALVLSAGPRRGFQLMAWRHGVVLAVAAAAAGLLWRQTYGAYLAEGSASQRAVAVAVLVVVGATMAASSRLGGYLALLFVIMFYPFALQLGQHTGYVVGQGAPGWLPLMYGPPLLLACAVAVMAGPAWRRAGDGRLTQGPGLSGRCTRSQADD